MKSEIVLDLYKENMSLWIEDLSKTTSRQMNLSRCCRESIDRKCLDGSRSYRLDRNFLVGSRICQETIETNSKKLQWIEDVLRSIEKNYSKGLNR